MKKVFQLVLLVAIIVAGYWLFKVLDGPVQFQKTLSVRSADVVVRIKDIRSAERAYKRVYGKFTGDFDTLINFVKNDSMVFEIAMGSLDDSAAFAQGRVKAQKVKIAVKDTIFGKRVFNYDDLAYIPHSQNEKFKLAARELKTESSIVIPVLCISAEYKTYMSDVDPYQELINLYNLNKEQDKFPGIKVGSLEKANNEAGNWED